MEPALRRAVLGGERSSSLPDPCSSLAVLSARQAVVWKGVRQVLNDLGDGNARTSQSMVGVAFGAAAEQSSWDDSAWLKGRSFILTVLFGQPRAKPAASSLSVHSTVALSSDIRISSAHWAALRFALSCWTSRGLWVSQPDGYAWVPDPSCPPYTTRVARGVACGVATRLDALLPSHRRGLSLRALFIGDSLSRQFYQGFVSNAPHSLGFVAHTESNQTPSDCEHHDPGVPILSCATSADGMQPLYAAFRSADSLAPQPACNLSVGLSLTDWASELGPGPSIVLLSRGTQHGSSRDAFVESWRATLRLLRQNAPDALIVAWTNPGGRPEDSTNGTSPIPKFEQSGDTQSGASRQNAVLQTLINDEFPGVLVLDVEHVASLCPDAGTGESRGGALDCLAFRDGLLASGIVTLPHFLLYNALWLLADLL